MDLKSELTCAVNALRRAAELCRAVQRTITAETLAKKDRSPVTTADFASQAVIVSTLTAEFPDLPVVGEEEANALRDPAQGEFLRRVVALCCEAGLDATPDSVCRWIDLASASPDCKTRRWTLDPIDGTKGFLRGEQYAVSLALLDAEGILMGLLACPNLSNGATPDSGTLFHAVRGGGAWMQPLFLDPQQPAPAPQRISVSGTADRSQIRWCESVESGHSSQSTSARLAEILGMTERPIRMDSQAKYGVVARGEADAYLRLPTSADYRENVWDHAGGAILVEEAGGRVTDVAGRQLDFSHGRRLEANRGVVVTNGRVHEAILSALAGLAE